MRKYILKEKVIENVEVLDKIICDECKKEITEDYYKVTTGHNDWGSESWDSANYLEFCSYECMMKYQIEYWEEYENSDTAYFDIRKKYR